MLLGQLFFKIDFRNAFNKLRRDAILEAIAKHFPELLPYATSTMNNPSDLQFGEFVMLSEESAQRGDPLGPLYLVPRLVFKEQLESLQSWLSVTWMTWPCETLWSSFSKTSSFLESTVARLGIEVKRSKCEVVDTPTRLGSCSHHMMLNCRKPVCPQLSFLNSQFQLDITSTQY